MRNSVTTLWGHEFRVVSDGPAGRRRSGLVESLMTQHHDSSEKDDEVAALRRLAEITVEKAEHLAKEIQGQAEKEAERRSARIVSEAEHVAEAITERAAGAATAIEAESRKKARQKLADLEANLLGMKRWATEEFQGLKELEERMQFFLSSFETVLSWLQGETDWQDPKVVDGPQALASEDQGSQLDAKEAVSRGKYSE